jgi:hypothetical protein
MSGYKPDCRYSMMAQGEGSFGKSESALYKLRIL